MKPDALKKINNEKHRNYFETKIETVGDCLMVTVILF